MAKEKYNIYHKGKKVAQNLSEEAFFERMEEFGRDFYETGVPHPDDLRTEMIKDEPFDNRELLNG